MPSSFKDVSEVALMPEYKTGMKEDTVWGAWEILDSQRKDNGEELCDKKITVNPGYVMSLQAHAFRREYWEVLEGTLTIVVDGETKTLGKGEGIRIPQSAVHCMGNLDKEPCVVFERQEGSFCREGDIVRIADANGRPTQSTEHPQEEKSKQLYSQILQSLATTT